MGRETLIARLARAAQPGRPLLTITVPPQVARFLAAAGAQSARNDSMTVCSSDVHSGSADEEGNTGPLVLAPLRATAREIVAELSPDELGSFDRLDRLDDQEVTRRFARGERQEALSFPPTVEAITPVVWIALVEAARQFGGKGASVIARAIGEVIRKILRRPAKPAHVPLLTPAQLALVRGEILKIGRRRRWRLSPETAEGIADAVIARLALPSEKSPGPGAPGDTGKGDARP